jgi:hypothetical protein
MGSNPLWADLRSKDRFAGLGLDIAICDIKKAKAGTLGRLG